MPVSSIRPASTAPHAAAAGFGIYVHWPFCEAKCPYCDFNSHVRPTIDEARWTAALARELSHYADQTAGSTVTSVFFGGGTPSLMSPQSVGRLIDRVCSLWPVADDVEITLEANPSSVEAEKFRGFRDAGVNRLSVGVQSLKDPDLRFLGRVHDAAAGRRALAVAESVFANYSADFIYALPDQTGQDWGRELADILALAGPHLSLYQLTIEPNTGFAGAVRRGALQPLDDDRAAALLDVTEAATAAAGLPAYEVSNHARPDHQSRHNLTYWRYGDYVGVGPGAHGRIDRAGARFATIQQRKPETWLGAVEASGHGTASQSRIDAAAQVEEMLLMGLRLTEGVDLSTVADRTGVATTLINGQALSELLDEDLLWQTGQRIGTTPRGRPVLNAVLAHLL